jgi:hypothetical protein
MKNRFKLAHQYNNALTIEYFEQLSLKAQLAYMHPDDRQKESERLKLNCW